MIPANCKRLAEVDFPIAVVSRHAAHEKTSGRHGHPSTLHLWWARRPLAACRSMLLALLLPDPCDEHCPPPFPEEARGILAKLFAVGRGDMAVREALLRFIGEFANWDLASNVAYLEAGRRLVKAAHGAEPPLVVDPFAGGGSIPLEALRLGCDTFASDLNPVACLILKTMLEDIPRHGLKLAEELRRVGSEIRTAAEQELADFYPPDPDGARPIAYLWARTARCEAPDCGAEIPLVRSFWLCNKASRRHALRPRVVKGKPPKVEFEIYQPKGEDDLPRGTVTRAKAECLACQRVLSPDRVRAQLREKRGGANDARMLAVVTLKAGAAGRQYRLPTDRDLEAVRKAQRALDLALAKSLPGAISDVPDEPLPPQGTLGFRVQLYGMTRWGDLFTGRQKLAMSTFARLTRELSGTGSARGALALALGRAADQCSSLVRWRTTVEAVAGTFGRQALPIMWDFVEIVPIGQDASNYAAAVAWVAEVIEMQSRWADSKSGQVQLADACEPPLPHATVGVYFTDPPYYDAIPYADLSDFFFVWLKRCLPQHPLLRDPYDGRNQLTPKTREIVQDETKTMDDQPKDREFFKRRMALAFAAGRQCLREDGIGTVVFAHKTTEGWEALLQGMIDGGWTITGSWPLATERPSRLRSQDSAALATSVHLVCRPRAADDVGDWAAVLRELPKRVGEWMERLASEGVRGADLVFACIGPALEVFSRYAHVETPEGRRVGLDECLEKIWETVGRKALEQVLGSADTRVRKAGAPSLEEDARLTALFLWTLQSTENTAETVGDTAEQEEGDDENEPQSNGQKSYTLIYDVVRRFAQPLGIRLEDWEGRVISTEKGLVRLLTLDERAKSLFGEEGASAVADQIESRAAANAQLTLFAEEPRRVAARVQQRTKKSRNKNAPAEADLERRREATTLDNVHAAMLLQRGGRTNALRKLLEVETKRGPEFLRLANALSALYPKYADEKRLLDAMLLSAPRS